MDVRPPLESFFKKSPLQKEDLEPEATPQSIARALRGQKGEKGDKGEPGSNGITGEEGPLGPKGDRGEKGEQGEQGERGFPGEEGRPGKDGKDGESAPSIEPEEITGKQVIDKINKNKTAKISKAKIEGLEEIENKSASTEKRLQNWISLGGSRQTIIQSNGTNISTGATTINFTNGTLAVPSGNDGSTINYTAPSGGGGSGFQAPTGTVDGSNKVFVFVSAPKVVVVDQGRAMQKTSSDGTANWTGTTTITLTVAPTFDIYATA